MPTPNLRTGLEDDGRTFECCPDSHCCSRLGRWGLVCARWFPIVFVFALLIASIYVFFVRLCSKLTKKEYIFSLCLVDYLIYGDIPRVVQGWLYIATYWALAVICTYCYCRAAFGDPGSPDQFNIKITINDAEEQAAFADSQYLSVEDDPKRLIYLPRSTARMCGICNAPKPPRTHHCSTCRHCFLKMDHHCVWLDNCVGFMNYKYFFCLLFWATFMCGFIFGATLEVLIQQLVYDELTGFSVVWLVLTVLSFALGLSTAMLLCYHSWLICKGMTTIEHIERTEEREDWKRKQRLRGSQANLLSGEDPTKRMPNYSEGIYQNICAALGPNPLLWLIPYRNCRGNGIRFMGEEARRERGV